jgi:lipopolysaccharide cholinephosphotransferase
MSKQLMRPDLPDEHGFLPLQNKILEIMVDVDKVCRENDIDYYIMGGTALGAKRHGGFIPWDDDLDIYMTPDNYKKFSKCFDQLGRDKYVIQEHGKVNDMVQLSKVRMNGTTYIEPLYKDKEMHHGIFIDIFMLHNCPNIVLQQKIQYFWSKYIDVLSLAHRGYSRRKGAAGFLIKVFRMLPENFLRKFAMRSVYKYDDKKTDYYCNFFGKARFKQGKYKREIFGTPTDVDFETVKLMAPEKLHEFLKQRFGDYMKVPSPERIKWEQHAEIWDTNKDFREYVKVGEMKE